MGGALLRGILAKNLCRAEDVAVHDAVPAAVAALRQDLPGLRAAGSNRAAADSADAVLVCVKPADIAGVMAEAAQGTGAPLLISIAAGVRLEALEAAAGPGSRVIRVMPNTPALIGRGASAYSPGSRATAADAALADALLGAVGTVSRVAEKLLDAVTGLSGSGPAYVYEIIDALASGGVLMGLPRDAALTLAAQTVAGAADMVLQTGTHPAILRDQVTSPGGTTIAALATLEAKGMRSALIEAVRTATLRAGEMGK